MVNLSIMVRILLVLCVLGFFTVACKDKKTVSLKGDEPLEINDFISFFPDLDLPYTLADTFLTKKISDSFLIPQRVFNQFIPDSVLKKDFGKNIPRLYVMGKTKEKGKETYLFIKAVQATRRVAYLITFDKKNKYLTAMALVRKGFDKNYAYSYGSLDKKFQITTYREKKGKGEETNFKRNVYIYNSASNAFTLILTEPNEEIIQDIINPIDTLPGKNKYAGDYESNKKNLVSFRDGRTPQELVFFTHFEKNKGECVGELKGTARFLSAKKAVYNQSGNPCTLEFTFTANAVVMKELEGCGTYRDIKCFFDGTFPKKKKKQLKNNAK